SFNEALRDLSALQNLHSLGGGLNVSYNASLPVCAVWALESQTGVTCSGGFAPCTGNTGTGSCGTLPPDFQCVPGAHGPGVYDRSLMVYGDNTPAVFPNLSGVNCITGDVFLSGPGVSDLSALTGLTMVGGSVFISNTALTSLHGLESL